MPHLQQDTRLLLEAVVLSMQEMIEKPQLQLAAVVRVEMGPVLDAVRFEPLVLRGRAHEAFEVSPGMQGLSPPIGGGEERGLHLRPDGGTGAVIRVIERVGADVVAEGGPVLRKLCFGERFGSANELPMHA